MGVWWGVIHCKPFSQTALLQMLTAGSHRSGLRSLTLARLSILDHHQSSSYVLFFLWVMESLQLDSAQPPSLTPGVSEDAAVCLLKALIWAWEVAKLYCVVQAWCLPSSPCAPAGECQGQICCSQTLRRSAPKLPRWDLGSALPSGVLQPARCGASSAHDLSPHQWYLRGLWW